MAQQIHLLPELQPVLLQWSKAVLRDRPEDVLTYSRDYFAEQATQRRMAGYVLAEKVRFHLFRHTAVDLEYSLI